MRTHVNRGFRMKRRGGASVGNQAIQLAAGTGRARIAATLTALESAQTLCFRLRVKGSTLIPGASTNRALVDSSDASGLGTTGAKAILALQQDGAGIVTPYMHVGGLGLNAFDTYAASAIVDPTAWHALLWTWNPASTNYKRQFYIWKSGTTLPVKDYSLNFATSANFSTTAGQGILSFGATLSALYGSNLTDWDYLAIYAGSAYDNYAATSGEPPTPTGTDPGILACWNLNEGSGASSANAVAGGPALALTGATWEAGY